MGVATSKHNHTSKYKYKHKYKNKTNNNNNNNNNHTSNNCKNKNNSKSNKNNKSNNKKYKTNMDVASHVPTFIALVSEVIRNPLIYEDEDYIEESISMYRRFMIAIAEGAPTKISPDVMWLWYLHQLHATDYSDACKMSFDFGSLISGSSVIKEGEEFYESDTYDFKYALNLKALALKQKEFLCSCKPFCENLGDISLYRTWEKEFIEFARYDAELTIGANIIWRTYLHFTDEYISNNTGNHFNHVDAVDLLDKKKEEEKMTQIVSIEIQDKLNSNNNNNNNNDENNSNNKEEEKTETENKENSENVEKPQEEKKTEEQQEQKPRHDEL